MITLENLTAFALGMLVVYLMFRSMGVLVLVFFIGLSSLGVVSVVSGHD